MAVQQDLFNRSDAAQSTQPQRPRAANDPPPAPVWLQRASLVMLVLFCFYVGILLAVLPWSPRYWDANGWLLMHPTLDRLMQHGWMRGLISGLGLLDIWIGVSELLHYRDYRP